MIPDMKKALLTASLLIFCVVQILAQRPVWVDSLVIDPEYYVGISSCEKSLPDYQSTATKKALSLITEQIQVTITSSNELYTQENNDQFSQDFFQSVKSFSSIKLQGYELYQAWENDSVYYVYYRLSKLTYRDNLAFEYDNALNNSVMKAGKADTLMQEGKFDEAVSAYLEASKFLEEPLSNTFIPDKHAQVANQWYDIRSELLKILYNFQLQPLQPKYEMTKALLLTTDFEIQAKYAGGGTPVSLPNIPVIFDLSGNINAFENKSVNTDNTGTARNRIVNIYNEAMTYTIRGRIDFKNYLERRGDYEMLQGKEFDNLFASSRMVIEVIPVVVCITSTELVFSENTFNSVLKNELSNYLRTQNITFTDKENESDYTISLKSDTRKGNIYEDVYSVFLDIDYTIHSMPGNTLVFSGNQSNIKGVSLSYEAAAKQAYNNARTEIKDKLGRVILPYLK